MVDAAGPAAKLSLMTTAQPGPLAAPIAAAPARDQGPTTGIFLIGAFDLVKAVFFLVAAVGVFHLVDRDTHVELTRLLHVFRISGDHAFVRTLLLKADLITDPDKRILTEVLLLYTVLYTIEGVGLLLRQRWAEYFAVAMTVIPLPFEVHTLLYHAVRSPGARLAPRSQHVPTLLHNHIFVLKLAVLIINVGIVWYLVVHLWRAGKRRAAAKLVSPRTVEEVRPTVDSPQADGS